ncbi:MAG: glycerol-3-phosphate 1-O-acyltransferase PlsY [Gammaproteobacteria bacterium]
MLIALYVAASYLAGSLSAAILVCRALGKGDPRTVGSGNPGATNVLRAFGKGPAAATLAGDLLKGFVPVALGVTLNLPPAAIAGAGLAAFLGHLFPLYFGFQGGKGVATLIGVILGFDWRLGVAFVGTWLAIAMLTRYSSLAALTAAALTPAFALGMKLPLAYAVALVGMVAAVFWRHRDNIRRLRAGTEGRIGARRA